MSDTAYKVVGAILVAALVVVHAGLLFVRVSGAAQSGAADAVTVGDTRFDVEAARKAGMKTIAFLCGGTSGTVLRQAGAIAIYNDPADFLAHYDELIKGFTSESFCGRL